MALASASKGLNEFSEDVSKSSKSGKGKRLTMQAKPRSSKVRQGKAPHTPNKTSKKVSLIKYIYLNYSLGAKLVSFGIPL